MGISHLRLFQLFTMRAFIVACFAVASVCADAGADADAYTIAQVQAGVPALKTALDGQTRVVYGLNGVNTVLNRAYAAAPAVAAPVYSSYAARPFAAYSTLGYHGLYKREAEAEPEADAYTLAQVALGKPIADAYATGHPHNVGVVTGVSASPVAAYSAYAAPVYSSYAARPIAAYSNLGLGLGYHGIYKREAEAEADAYTLAQVALGKPIADAYATGHPHNVGVVTGVSASGYAAPYAPLTTYSTLGYRSLYGAGYYY